MARANNKYRSQLSCWDTIGGCAQHCSYLYHFQGRRSLVLASRRRRRATRYDYLLYFLSRAKGGRHKLTLYSAARRASTKRFDPRWKSKVVSLRYIVGVSNFIYASLDRWCCPVLLTRHADHGITNETVSWRQITV